MAAGRMMSVRLISSDDHTIVVEPKAAKMSEVLKNIIEDLPEEDSPIRVPNVTGDILALVMQYCDNHKNDPPGSPVEIGDFDAAFIRDKNKDTLINLIKAADFLQIDGLVNLICPTLANKFIQAINIQRIFEAFRTENKFTEQEEQDVLGQNQLATELKAMAAK
jgi:S-phase kinase-associated protein 1